MQLDVVETGDLDPTSRERRDLVCVVPFCVPMTCSKAGHVVLSDRALSEWVGSGERFVKAPNCHGFPQPLLQFKFCKHECQLRGPPLRKPVFDQAATVYTGHRAKAPDTERDETAPSPQGADGPCHHG